MTNPMPFDTAMALLHDAAAGLAVVKGGDSADHFRLLLDATSAVTARMLLDIADDRNHMPVSVAKDVIAEAAYGFAQVHQSTLDHATLWLATAALVSTADLLSASTAAD